MFRLSSSTPPWILEDPSAYLSTTLFCSHQWKMIKQLQRNPSTRIQILCLVSYIFSTQDKLYVIKLLYLLDLNLNLYLNTLIICLIILKIMALFLIYWEILGAFVLCVILHAWLGSGLFPGYKQTLITLIRQFSRFFPKERLFP